MKLLSIKLKNFRQHRSSEINFSEGLSAIIGQNGSGKSTLVEAIAFNLYGSRALRGKVAEARTYDVPASEETSVELKFDHEGKVYRIHRDLNDAKIYQGGQAEALVSGTKAVTERISEILGLSLEEFLASYYTEQKSLEFLSGQKGAAEREKFISRMMGYDRLEKIQKLLREDRRDLKNEITGLSAGLGEREELEKRIEREQGSLTKLNQEEQEAAKVLAQAELSEKKIAEDYEAKNAKFQSFQKLSRDLEIAEHNYKKQVSQKEEQQVKYQELQKEIKAKLDKFNLPEEEVKLDKVEEFYNQINSEYVLANSELSINEKKLKALKKLKDGSDCPTCGQILGEEFKAVAKKLESEVKKFKDSAKKLKDELAKAEELYQAVKAASKDIHTRDHLQNELDGLDQILKKSSSETEALRTKVEKLEFNQEDFESLQAKYESVKGLVNTSRLQKVRIEGKVRESEALLKRSQTELLDFDQKNADLKSKQKDHMLLDQSDELLTEFRHYLNDHIRPRLAELASSYLGELSDGRYTELHIDADFSPMVYEDGHLKNVLSGGEEDLLNLCLRLALSTLIAERAGHSLSFLILDEVFGSLDENRRFNVLTLLERLGNRFEQILVITHLDDIKEGVNNLLYINYDEANGAMSISSSDWSSLDLNV